ncbi:MAG: CHAT domain-containing protein, partial [Trebonia sp.]
MAGHLPAGHARRSDVLSDLGVARLAAGPTDAAALRAGLEATRDAAAGCPPGHPRRAAILLRTAAALAVNAQAAYAPEAVDQGIDVLAEALRSAGLDTFAERSRCLYGLGYTLLIRYEHTGQSADLGLAIATLEEARAGLEPVPGDPFVVPLLRALAWAYRQAGAGRPGLPRRQARSAGRSVLHAHARAVLLQSGSRHGVEAARLIGEDALRLAGWCLADGLVYLIPSPDETGGHALIVRGDGVIEECGLPSLSAGAGSAVARFAEAHHNLRHAADTAGLLAMVQWRDQLDDLCDWAWTAAIGPVLDRLRPAATPAPPPRLVIAPMGVLGIVPWHAARRGAPGPVRYACAEAVFATCASARQFIEAAARQGLPLSDRTAVFVANPGGDLPWSTQEADAICSALYSGAVRLGGSEQAATRGAGTSGEVLACLSADGLDGVCPAVLHVGSHARAGDTPEESRLLLAGGDLLISRILAQARTRVPGSPGRLIILAACTSDLTL